MVDRSSSETILPPDGAVNAEGVQGAAAVPGVKEDGKETRPSNAFLEKMVQVLLDQTLVDSFYRLEGFAEAVREFTAKKEERFALPEGFSAGAVTNVVANSLPKAEGDNGGRMEEAPRENIMDVIADPKFGNALTRFLRAVPQNIRGMVRGNTPIFRPIPGFEKGEVNPNRGVSYITPIQTQPTQPK